MDARTRAARLAAVLYALGGLTLAATSPFLTRPRALLSIAALALVSAAVVPRTHLPIGVPLAWGVTMIGLVGLWAGELSHFLLFYGLAALYVGLTLPPGAWRWVSPLYAASVALALLGREPLSPDLFGALALATLIGEVLTQATSRSRKASQGTEALLDAVTTLHNADSEGDAADQVAGLAHTLLKPDAAVVMVATGPGSALYTNRGQRGLDVALGALVVDITGRSGIGLALREGRAIFVADAQASPLLAQNVVARLPFTSVLFVPVPGEGGHLGCVVLGWNDRKTSLDRFEERVVSLLSDQAGTLLERLRRVGALRQEARTDPLTGLSNRRAFLEALDRLRPGGAVVFLDLDHFKALNDSRGHQAGDTVLVDFARALRASVRDGDCAARYGGEEFAVVLPSAASVDMGPAAAVVVDRLRAAWDGPVTFSVGIAVHRTGDAASLTLARADAAVYQAKAAGRNTLVVA